MINMSHRSYLRALSVYATFRIETIKYKILRNIHI